MRRPKPYNRNLRPVELPPGLHPATAQLVVSFALALAKKLRLAEEKYGFTDGWLRDDWEDECRKHLYEHLEKGDPRDVAAYCAFMWAHGWATFPAAPQPPQVYPALDEMVECHKLDTPTHVFFYEQDFYVLSNFSSFQIVWRFLQFPTTEHAYHFERFIGADNEHRVAIMSATSAHEAFRYAQEHKQFQRPDWDEIKVGTMRDILRAKVDQHEYVRRKLLATGNRVLVEDSWRDDFWGWGPNRDGQNMLGKLWMEIRAELRARSHSGKAKEAGANKGGVE